MKADVLNLSANLCYSNGCWWLFFIVEFNYKPGWHSGHYPL